MILHWIFFSWHTKLENQQWTLLFSVKVYLKVRQGDHCYVLHSYHFSTRNCRPIDNNRICHWNWSERCALVKFDCAPRVSFNNQSDSVNSGSETHLFDVLLCNMPSNLPWTVLNLVKFCFEHLSKAFLSKKLGFVHLRVR